MGLLSRLLGSASPARSLLADLSEDYRAECAQAAHLRAQAERAPYPQVARELRRLAEVEERHAGWLRDRLTALGAPIPSVEPPLVVGDNQWERIGAAHEMAQRKRRRLVEQIGRWDPEEPEAVGLLARIEEEDQRELAAYDALVMRSDPQSIN